MNFSSYFTKNKSPFSKHQFFTIYSNSGKKEKEREEMKGGKVCKKTHKTPGKTPHTSQSCSHFTKLQIDKRALTECMKEMDHHVSDTQQKISRY